MEQVAKKKEIPYKRDLCQRSFISHKTKRGAKFCKNCAEIVRVVRKWVKDGEWVKGAQEP